MSAQKILIVDDKPENLVSLERALSPIDAEFVRALSGNEALIESLNHRFSLIILDAQMPLMDGFELARHLRSEPDTRHVPIIFLSAVYDETKHVFAGYESGAVDYLIKPYDPQILKEKVKIFLELDQYRFRLELLVKEKTAELLESNQRISEQKAFLESIFESLSHPLMVIDADTFAIDLQNSTARHWGIKPNLGTTADKAGSSSVCKKTGDTDQCSRLVNIVKTTQSAVHREFSRTTDNGVVRYYDIYAYPVFNEAREVKKVIESIFDVTERKQAEEHQQMAASAIKNVGEGIFVTDANGVVQSVNPAFTQITGYPAEEIIGGTLETMRSPNHDQLFYDTIRTELDKDKQWKGELWIYTKDGESLPLWLSLTAVSGEEADTCRYVGAGRDVSQLKKNEEDIRRRANYDALTGLPNRILFADRLAQAIRNVGRNRKQLALLFLDLDHFKDLNDSHGHAMGDELLKVVAKKFSSSVRKHDTVSRLGGDEFTVVLDDVVNAGQDAAIVANKLIRIFDRSLKADGYEVFLGVSIGIAIYPDDGEDVDSLIKNADTAMYSAKEKGRNNYQFFSSAMEEKIVNSVSLETDLRNDLERDGLYVDYQPIMSLATSKIVGMEALVRWKRHGNKFVSPAIFIPIAEERGLIIPIGISVMRQACHEIKQLNRRLNSRFTISINLSARQFKEKSIITQIGNILTETDLDPHLLTLEVPETTIMDDIENSINTMNTLKSQGIRISLDDFGSGYSSFNYLKKLPVDNLKLDKDFIGDILTDGNAAKIAVAIVSLATDLGMAVIAEGVEEQAQLEFLRAQGCQFVQGYLFSAPLPQEQLEGYVLDSAV